MVTTDRFNVEIAKRYGIPAAVIFQRILEGVQENFKQKEHCRNGLYWFCCGYKEFASQFSYMSPRQIEYAVRKLVEDRVLLTGNFNVSPFDQTLWYTISPKGFVMISDHSEAAYAYEESMEDFDYKEEKKEIEVSEELQKEEKEPYFVIYPYMREELDLRGSELLTYAIINQFSLCEKGAFSESAQYMADWVGCTRRCIMTTLASLVDKGLITKKDVMTKYGKRCEYSVVPIQIVRRNRRARR